METKCAFRSNITAISSLSSAKLLMVKVTGLLYCKEYLTGLCGLKREASHPTEKNAEKKKRKYYIQGKLPLKLSLTLLTSKPHVPSGTPKFYAKEKNISRKKTAYLVILSRKLF